MIFIFHSTFYIFSHFHMGTDHSQCHLDKDYTKNSVYRNMYPVLFL